VANTSIPPVSSESNGDALADAVADDACFQRVEIHWQ
jgi:hypothetical protein